MQYVRLLAFVALLASMGMASYSYVDTGFGLVMYAIGAIATSVLIAFIGVVLLSKLFKDSYYTSLLSKLTAAYTAFKSY